MSAATGSRADPLRHVAVVMLCHDRRPEVERNVPIRLRDVHESGLELVVVDNASTDGTREWLASAHARDPAFVLVLNDQNVGVGAGRNAGWVRTDRSIVVTVDEDVVISRDQLIGLAEFLGERPDVGIVHPIVVDARSGRPLVQIVPPPSLATNFQGACYAIRREVLTAVGLHDPQCDFGGEELDLSVRTRAAGWEVVQLSSMRVAHPTIVRVTSEARRRRARWVQNHARVLWRWFPRRHALRWSLLMLAAEARAAVRRRRPGEIGEMAVAWIRGAVEGNRHHSPVPGHVVRFYASRLGLLGTLRRLRGSRR